MDNIRIYSNREALVEGLSVFLMEEIEACERKYNLALSGGSTPVEWFKHLAAHYQEKINWEKINFFWGDERCVPPDDAESNFGVADTFLFSKLNKPLSVYRVSGEKEPETAAEKYENQILKTIPSVNGTPVFDLIILGIGNDGHTASIFPEQQSLWNSNSLCVVASHPESGQKRVSFTGKLINKAKKVVFLVSGSSKASILKAIIKPDNDNRKFPAGLVNPGSGKLYWFIDKQAAKLIS